MKIGDTVYTKHPENFGDGKWSYTYMSAKVVGIWQRYAILRRASGCVPFLELIKTLEKNQKEKP